MLPSRRSSTPSQQSTRLTRNNKKPRTVHDVQGNEQGSFYWGRRFRTLNDRDGNEAGSKAKRRLYAVEKWRDPATAVAMKSNGVLGYKRFQQAKAQQATADKTAQKQGALLLLLLLRSKLTYTRQTKQRIQVKSRSSLEVRHGWMSMYEDQAPVLVCIVIEGARSKVPGFTSLIPVRIFFPHK